MTVYEELVSILSSLNSEQMNEYCAMVADYYAGNAPDAVQRFIGFLPVYAAKRQVPPPRNTSEEVHA